MLWQLSRGAPGLVSAAQGYALPGRPRLTSGSQERELPASLRTFHRCRFEPSLPCPSPVTFAFSVSL